MATRNVRPPTVEMPIGGNGYSWEMAEAATQTFLTGALLVHSAGYAQESGADPADGTVLGISHGPGNNEAAAGTDKAGFSPFFPGTLIEANLCSGAAGDHTLAQANVGTSYGMIKRTVSGLTHWVIDSSETDSGDVIVRVVGLRDDIGDVNGRVFAVVKSAKCAFGG